MKRRWKDRKVRERVDRIWEVRTSRKARKKDRRRVKESDVGSRRGGVIPSVGLGRPYQTKGLPSGGMASVGLPIAPKGVTAPGERLEGRRREMGEEKKRWRERGKRVGEIDGEVSKVRNRCVETGHGRSMIRWFRKSGRKVRERARRGKVEGVYGVSW
jgi:ribosomal protein S14